MVAEARPAYFGLSSVQKTHGVGRRDTASRPNGYSI